MKTLFIATSNSGKQAEIEKYLKLYGDQATVTFPDKTTQIQVNESGTTFEENALLKAQAYRASIGDESLYYVGDDSGIVIPALNNEPGVFTRRWSGHEMTDEEIREYCMEKMKNLKGSDRAAIFETVLAVITPEGSTEYFYGRMHGRILEQPLDTEPQPGFPFRSIFWVDGIDMPIFEIHSLTTGEKKGFLTHREEAFRQLFLKL